MQCGVAFSLLLRKIDFPIKIIKASTAAIEFCLDLSNLGLVSLGC